MKAKILLFVAFCSIFYSCDKKVPQAQIPIIAWLGVPASETSLERYQELADCGINVNMEHFYTMEQLQQALDIAQQTGIKIQPCFDCFFRENDSLLVEVIKKIKDHPALFAYHLMDEPEAKDFPWLAEKTRLIREIDTTHPVYINLFPYFAGEDRLGGSYQDYLDEFVKQIDPDFISFDYYPISTKEKYLFENWPSNLEAIAKKSTEAGIPFWAFTLGTAHHAYPIATRPHLRIQLYSDLAYGAAALQYFTYWTPTFENYHEGPISREGKVTPTYYVAQAVNKEIQARAGVFVGSKVLSTNRIGEIIPKGCTRLETLPEHVRKLSTDSEGALVSVLENGRWHYLVVVNGSYKRPIELEAAFDEKACLIDREGKAVKIAGSKTVFTIEEGDVAIFRYKK